VNPTDVLVVRMPVAVALAIVAAILVWNKRKRRPPNP
jgi:hypothetical protein